MIKCWIFGNKQLFLNALKKEALITVYEKYYHEIIDNTKPIVNVHMCERCKYLYWESPLWD